VYLFVCETSKEQASVQFGL